MNSPATVLSIDTETNGIGRGDPEFKQAQTITQIGMVFCTLDGKLVSTSRIYVKGAKAIHRKSVELSGITLETLETLGVAPAVALRNLAASMSCFNTQLVIGHNISFDCSQILFCCRDQQAELDKPLHSLLVDMFSNKTFCNMKNSKACCPNIKKPQPSLSDLYDSLAVTKGSVLCAELKREPHKQHTADYDAELAARCFFDAVRLGFPAFTKALEAITQSSPSPAAPLPPPVKTIRFNLQQLKEKMKSMEPGQGGQEAAKKN